MSIVNSKVKEYVEEKDIESTRIALTTMGYITDYDSFKNFEASTEYARERINGLFEKDDEQSYDTSLTIDSYKRIIKLMMSNFSEEKYANAIRIGSSAFTEKQEEHDSSTNETREEAPVSESFFTKLMQHPMRIVISGIIIIAVIAIIISLLK